ncbi:WYL domain-containing protein [Clostridiaceae bacterium]|nr:WYL domain-containing protein [Clostridiaceae bacterium]RKI14350.1 WYL domain-containing protein [bacterium 1XD21-70]
MSEYKELIKQFDKIRSYVRDFYIYGFKTRDDFCEKSGRTYDNQRRRMESWFSGYIRTEQNGHKKSVFLTLDSGRMAVNPLYQAWKSKAFTGNDISLRFFLPDLLSDGRPRSIETIADELQKQYHCLFDTQTIRRKLAFYEKEGLAIRKKEGKQYLYGITAPLPQAHPGLFPALWLAVSFFQGAAPFGFIGSTILDFWNQKNDFFRFRSDYLIHTLEDEVLLPILRAMEQKCQIRITAKSTKNTAVPSSRPARFLDATPLKILTSTQTGRRYLCAWQERTRCFSTFRLDSIQNVELLLPDALYDTHMASLQRALPYVWGVSFGSLPKTGPETVTMEVCFDEKEEDFILNRLQREGRGGSLNRLKPGVYQYTRLCADATEFLPWAKSFTGRIRAFYCSNPAVEQRFWDDMQKMKEYYFATGDAAEHEKP